MTVSVSVPASASNLGGGFDCVGVAVNRRLHVSVGVAAAGPAVAVQRSGTLAPLGVAPENDLIVAGFRAACVRAGRAVPDRLLVSADSDIPVGRGLGSSAAALVAGALAAAAWFGDARDPAGIIALGTEIEGHHDNVAPAVLGGAVFSAARPGAGVTTAAVDVHASLRFAFAIPD
ncbi:MAG: homoserine kinase, partial [Gemmatimonadaceae bacterium]